MGKSTAFALIAICFCFLSNTQVFADDKIGVEANRDTNIFQVAPSIINEKHYSSGENVRHQNVGKVLPYGAEIPRNDDAEPIKVEAPRKTQTHLKHFWSKLKSKDDMQALESKPTPQAQKSQQSSTGSHHQFVGNVLPPGAEIPDND